MIRDPLLGASDVGACADALLINPISIHKIKTNRAEADVRWRARGLNMLGKSDMLGRGDMLYRGGFCFKGSCFVLQAFDNRFATRFKSNM